MPCIVAAVSGLELLPSATIAQTGLFCQTSPTSPVLLDEGDDSSECLENANSRRRVVDFRSAAQPPICSTFRPDGQVVAASY